MNTYLIDGGKETKIEPIKPYHRWRYEIMSHLRNEMNEVSNRQKRMENNYNGFNTFNKAFTQQWADTTLSNM